MAGTGNVNTLSAVMMARVRGTFEGLIHCYIGENLILLRGVERREERRQDRKEIPPTLLYLKVQ